MNSSTRSTQFAYLSRLLFTAVILALRSSFASADGILLINQLPSMLMKSYDVSTGNCMPTNCAATCSPSCSSDQVCVLGTMSDCGKCPESRCISRSIVDPSAATSSSDSSGSSGGSNSALIGGVVGGLLGAGLLLCAIGFLVVRYKRKRGTTTLPFTFRGTSTVSEVKKKIKIK